MFRMKPNIFRDEKEVGVGPERRICPSPYRRKEKNWLLLLLYWDLNCARIIRLRLSFFIILLPRSFTHSLSLSLCVCVYMGEAQSQFTVRRWKSSVRSYFIRYNSPSRRSSFQFFFMCLCVFYLNDKWKKQLGFLKSNLGVKEISLTFNLLTFLWNFKWRQFWKILNWSKKRVMYHSDYWTMCYSDVCWRGAAKVSSNRRVQLLANNRQIIDCIANWSSQ